MKRCGLLASSNATFHGLAIQKINLLHRIQCITFQMERALFILPLTTMIAPYSKLMCSIIYGFVFVLNYNFCVFNYRLKTVIKPLSEANEFSYLSQREASLDPFPHPPEQVLMSFYVLI